MYVFPLVRPSMPGRALFVPCVHAYKGEGSCRGRYVSASSCAYARERNGETAQEGRGNARGYLCFVVSMSCEGLACLASGKSALRRTTTADEFRSFHAQRETLCRGLRIRSVARTRTSEWPVSLGDRGTLNARTYRFWVATATLQSQSKVVSVFLAVLCPAGRAPTSPAPRQFVQVTRSRVAFP